MWRTFVSAFNAVFLLHGLALAAFVAWLLATGRLDLERAQQIGRVLELTQAPGDQSLIQNSAAAGDSTASLAAAPWNESAAPLASPPPATPTDPPLPPSAVQVVLLEKQHQLDIQRKRYLADDAAKLRAQLLHERDALASERARFVHERNSWLSEREQALAADTAADFQRIVRLLESLPARQAKDHLVQLAEQEKLEEAARILRAMPSFAAAEIIRQFRPDEQPLAAALLEAMQSSPQAADAAAADDDNDRVGDAIESN